MTNRQSFRSKPIIVLERLLMRNIAHLNYCLPSESLFGEKKLGDFVVKSSGFGVRNAKIQITVLSLASWESYTN